MSRPKEPSPLKTRLFERTHLDGPQFELPRFELPHFDYAHFAQSQLGSRLARALRLPRPAVLRRYDGEPVIDGVVVIDGYAEAVIAARLRDALGEIGITVADAPPDPPAVSSVAAVIVDMTSITSPDQLETLRAIVAPTLRSLAPSGRVIAVVRPPEESSTAAMAAARLGVDGFVRSLAKELRDGGTANTIEIADLADEAVDATVRFLLSGRSAYVSGQRIRVGRPVGPLDQPQDWSRPLAGTVAVVTGAARGIGKAVAETLARDGATIVCVDQPSLETELAGVAEAVGGSALPLDVADPQAGQRIVEHCSARHGGVDIVAHVAGITRDRLLVHLDATRWREVIDVNLSAVIRMNESLLPALRDGGHLVLVSSTTGLAGNRGQTNFAASKAGVIALTEALARDEAVLAKHVTVNAVAPGFIASAMTDRAPMVAREVSKLLNSLNQAGTPQDVAETISWLCWPANRGVTGQTVRVCGQLIVGA